MEPCRHLDGGPEPERALGRPDGRQTVSDVSRADVAPDDVGAFADDLFHDSHQLVDRDPGRASDVEGAGGIR
jgi:hypothetical protein